MLVADEKSSSKMVNEFDENKLRHQNQQNKYDKDSSSALDFGSDVDEKIDLDSEMLDGVDSAAANQVQSCEVSPEKH